MVVAYEVSSPVESLLHWACPQCEWSEDRFERVDLPVNPDVQSE